MKILFFIGTLATGGAERQLSVLAKGLSRCGHQVSVVTLFPGGKIADDLKQEPRVKLISLWSFRSHNTIIRLFQLATAPLILYRLIGNEDCLYSMLEATNFIAWLATRFKKNTCLIWGIRSSNMEAHWKMALFDKFCALVSPSIKLLIANSHAGLKCLLRRGYCPQKAMVIPNGIDTEKFQYNEVSRRTIRNELGVSLNQPLVGIVGRLNPMKDHLTFLNAAALVAKEIEDVKFLCAGGGSGEYVEKLYALTKKLGLIDRVIWLGDRSDIVPIYSALDILVSSSSYGEGFSNVIGEAMSCGLPCIATDVGDSAKVVGVSTLIIEPRNPEVLSEAICKVIENNENINWHVISRDRIINNFSIEQLIQLTEQELGEMYVVS